MTTSTQAIRSLDRITADDESRSGAKAYNCARLKQAGFPVPDGLVVLSTAGNADLAALPNHPWFGALPDDITFAVRSSGIGEDGIEASFAGIHRTVLDVHRTAVAQAVAACRASGQSPPALEYRRAKGLASDAIEMGVLIQRMIDPVAAGVAFTINPVTGRDDEIVINSSWGLGESLVSGQIDPDEFVVGKRDRELRWSRAGGKGTTEISPSLSLTPDSIRELADLLAAIERHYSAPQDVEWCYDGSRFWIVQSRPVTTSRGRAPLIDETEWTRANIAEVLPDLTSPQVLSIFEDLLNSAERRYLGKLLAPEQELGPMVKSFCGRLHFNLSQVRRICAISGVTPALMLQSIGHAEAIHEDDGRPTKAPLSVRLSCLPDMLRLTGLHRRAANVIREHDAKTRRYMERFTAPDRRDLPDAAIWDVLDGWRRDAPEFMQTVLLLGNVLFHEAPVRRICEKVGFPFERLVYPQLAVGERSVSAQQAFDLVALADTARREAKVVQYLSGDAAHISHLRFALRGTAFLGQFESFLAKYGHRGRYEYDWSLPRYNEDPTPLLQALRAHVDAGPDDAPRTLGRQQREASDAWRAFEGRLSRLQKWTIGPGVKRSIRTIKQYYVWRERVRSDIARLLSALRGWHLVLAERFVERGWLRHRDEYFLITFAEIGDVVRGMRPPQTLHAIVADRLAQQDRYRALRMPLLMRASMLPDLIRRSGVTGATPGADHLTGQPVSGGCVDGEVVVVRDPADFRRMTRGAILVAPATDPSWTPLFTLASGVIVEVGGVLSHASTIAREYGLPAIANVKNATKLLRTGERVRLDANNGLVQRYEAVGQNSTTAPPRELVGAAIGRRSGGEVS
jgi:pyruvate,water dikinase